MQRRRNWQKRGMRSGLRAILSVAAASWSATVLAVSPNSEIADFKVDSLNNCYTGEDLGKALNMSNPLSLIGSVAFTTPAPGNTVKLNRQPMALPTVISEAAAPDQTTCSLNLRATADGSLNILGISVGASKDEVYSIQARLITRQALATVVENGQNMPILESAAYRSRFRFLLQSKPTATGFFLVDQISVYLIEVERYRKINANLSGVVAFFGGGGSYKRDENFKGARILVTGDKVPLTIDMFPASPAPAVPPTLAPSDVTSTLSAPLSQGLAQSLQSAKD